MASEVTPVQKVIQMMTEMGAKGKAEMEAEAAAYEEYDSFCVKTGRAKGFSIARAERDMEKLSADIQKADADAERLGREVADLDAQIADWKAELKKATEVRSKGNSDFQTLHDDYSESINALVRAQAELAKVNTNYGATVLAQLSSIRTVPASLSPELRSFLQMSQMPTAPTGDAYQFQSGNVVKMLEELQQKFEDERKTIEKDEANAKHAFEMTSIDLTDAIEAATEERDNKMAEKAQRTEDSAEAQGNLADTTHARDEDKKYLAELTATCEQKANDFAARQALRKEELEVLAKAIEIIGGKAVSGAADKHLPALMQKGTSLSQFLESSSNKALQARIAEFLKGRAEDMHSRALALVASQVAADHFGKVRTMISDLITRLENEAAEEADHKAWCDKELNENKHTRDAKTKSVNSLTATKEKLQAQIQKLTENIADLTAEVADLDAAVAKATDQRNKEHAKNTETIADAKAAIPAVEEALKILKEFYAKASTATSLAQGFADDAPATFDTPYRGMGDSNKGVVGMLEVIHSDFTRLEADTTSGEAAAQSAFDQFSATSAEDRAALALDIKTKGKEKTTKEGDLQETIETLTATQKELDAANKYYDELKGACLEAGVDYAERVAQREAEINSLNEALNILNAQ